MGGIIRIIPCLPGRSRREKMYCEKCGAKLEKNAAFCGSCGAPAGTAPTGGRQSAPYAQAGQTAYAAPPAPAAQQAGGGFTPTYRRRKPIVPVVIIAVVAAALLVWIFVFGGPGGGLPFGGGAGDRIFYTVNNDVYCNSPNGDKSERITEDGGYVNEGGEGVQFSLVYNGGAVTDDSGKKIVYLDNYDSNDSTYDLYLKDMNKPDEEPKKIDSGFSYDSYHVAGDFKSVVYTVNSTLYFSDFEDREKIDSDVRNFAASEDNSVIAYDLTDDEGSYLYKDGESRKLDSNSYLLDYNRELSVILLYEDSDGDSGDDVASIVLNGGEAQKLASGPDISIGSIADDGTFYFTVSDKISMLDYLVNDMGGDGDYYLDEYRSEDSSTWSYDLKSLYYFNGRESLKVAEDVSGSSLWIYNDSPKSFLTYNVVDMDRMGALNLSNVVDGTLSLSGWFYDEIAKNGESFLSVSGAEGVSLGQGALATAYYSDYEKNWLAYKFDEKEDGVGDLCKVKIAKGAVPEKVDDDIYGVEFVTPGGDIAYIKDVNKGDGDLCINGKRIDSDVAPGSALAFKSEGYKNYYYLCDYDWTDQAGVLKTVRGDKGEEIAADVHSFYSAGDGKMFVIRDWRTSRYNGDIVRLNGKDDVRIDSGVSGIIRIAPAASDLSPDYLGSGYGYYYEEEEESTGGE
jgi:hypothetical protein